MNPLPALISSLPDSGCSLQSTGDLCGSTMKPRPKAVYHLGTCTQCAGEGDVITIEADPLPLSLCPACLALILARSSGIRRAIREQLLAMDRKQNERRAKLERKTRADVERVAKLEKGKVGGFELGQSHHHGDTNSRTLIPRSMS